VQIRKPLAATEHDVQQREFIASNTRDIQVDDELAQRSPLRHVRGHGTTWNKRELGAANGPGCGRLTFAGGTVVFELERHRRDGNLEYAGKAIEWMQQINVVELDYNTLGLKLQLMDDRNGCLDRSVYRRRQALACIQDDLDDCPPLRW